MDKTIGGNELPARRFAYSWADEVEREEQEQRQQHQQCERPPPRREERRERTKTDPFGAARPREVVLADKGVDWRERDRELDAPHRSATCRTRRAQGKRDARAAPAPPPPTTTTPGRRDTGLTPTTGHRKIDAPPVSCSGAWRGKRKCAGEVPMPAGQVLMAAADQGRRVFGELNIGSGGNSSRRSSKKSCDSAEIEGIEAHNVAGAAAGGENRGSSRAAAMSGMMKTDESEVGQKRVGKGRKRRKVGSKRTKKQQTLLL